MGGCLKSCMGSSAESDDEEVDRGKWSKKMDFILSCLGFAVGLGNVWRFPYLCYRNGGATFLIPYLIMLVIAGIPLFFLELALGQFASEGVITVWKMSPAFTGIGVCMVTVSAVVSLNYIVIITWAFYYMLVSFVSLDEEVPWKTCDNRWNTDKCRTDALPDLDSMDEGTKLRSLYDQFYNYTCVSNNLANMNVSRMEYINSTMVQSTVNNACKRQYTTGSAEYWENYVLRVNESDGFYGEGGFSVKLVFCLFLTWMLVFLCLIKGVKSSGKVVYFTATFPYIVLFALIIRGVTLPGHLDGIKFYMIPNLTRLADSKVWGDAASQIFYSLGPGWGGLLTMSSYNKFHNNCLRDTLIVAIVNCGTSLFAGFAIFSVLGHMSQITNNDIKSVVTEGPGLAFVAYPEGIARLPFSPFWAFLFFFMLVTLGLDTQFVLMESVISGLADLSPRFLRKYKMFFTLACCVVGFILGLPQVTKGGIYWFTLTDWYASTYNIMLIGLAEIVCVMYVYGITNVMQDIEMMLGHKPNIYWQVTWFALSPIAIVFIVIMSAVKYRFAYHDDYVFPSTMQGLGWFMSFGPVSWIFIIMIIQTIRHGPRKAFAPSPDWGPANPEDRSGRYANTTRTVHNESDLNGVNYPGHDVPMYGVDNVAFTEFR